MPIGMLIIGIMGVSLSFIMGLQSCAVFSLGAIFSSETSAIGLLALLASCLFFAASVCAIIGRRFSRGNKPAMILYFIAAVISFLCHNDFPDMGVYAFVSAIFGVISAYSMNKLTNIESALFQLYPQDDDLNYGDDDNDECRDVSSSISNQSASSCDNIFNNASAAYVRRAQILDRVSNFITIAVIAVFGIITLYAFLSIFSDKQSDTDIPPRYDGSNIYDNSTSIYSEPERAEYSISYSKAVAEKNSIGSTYTFSIVEITNTGTCDLYLSSGKFDFEDKSGNLLASRSMISVSPQIISPGEKAYYYESAIIDGIEAGEDLTIVPTVDIEKARTSKKEYPIVDVKFTDAEWKGGRFVGRIENNSSDEINFIRIDAILFDKDGKPLGVASTYLSDKIAPKSKSGFDFTTHSDIPFSVNFSDIASYKIIAYEY